MKTATDLKAAEVAQGTSQEERILARWAKHHPEARGFLKGGTYDDFDFVVFGQNGLVYCYLEVKFRRVPLSKYGDALFPLRKHAFAKLSRAQRLTPVLAVTEYSCGSLVEVDLAEEPGERRDVTRRDRPGRSVPHVLYGKTQMRVLEA